VGYTGGATASPTYRSVCRGDGHTEALRLRLETSVLTYEAFLHRFCADSHVATHPDPREKAQYTTAIWAQCERQREIATRVVAESGKAVRVIDASSKAWYDAEEYHQHFLGDPEELEYDEEELPL